MAAAYNTVDRQSDVLLPGCVKNIDEFIQSGWVAWQHSTGQAFPSGCPCRHPRTPTGFRVEATWHNTLGGPKTAARSWTSGIGRQNECSRPSAIP